MVRDEWAFNARLAVWWREVAQRLADVEAVNMSDWLRRRYMEHALALAYAERGFSVFGDGQGVDLELLRKVAREPVWVMLAGASYGADLSRLREERADFLLDLMQWLTERDLERGAEREQLELLSEMLQDDAMLTGVRSE